MTQKTPAEIEIEKLEKGCGKEISHNINNQIFICGKEPKVFIEDAEPLTKKGIKKVCSNPAEYFWELCPECKAKLSGLKQGIELGRKESEDLYEENNNLKILNELYLEQLSNQKKEIIEKIKRKITKIDLHRGVFKRSHFIIELKVLIKQISEMEKGK